MDALCELESLLTRLVERTREGRDAAELREMARLMAILKLELAKEQKERHQSMTELVQAKAQINVLQQQVTQLKASGHTVPVQADDLIEFQGALFVRKPGGRFVDKPYCRKCRAPMKAVSNEVPYGCRACHTVALFCPSELLDVLLQLRQQEGGTVHLARA